MARCSGVISDGIDKGKEVLQDGFGFGRRCYRIDGQENLQNVFCRKRTKTCVTMMRVKTKGKKIDGLRVRLADLINVLINRMLKCYHKKKK